MSLRILSGTFRGRILKTPKHDRTRPTQGALRSAVFNICQNCIEGAAFLDLFAGSGAMGLEALSRGAKSVCFIDRDPEALHCIKENIALLHVQDQSEVLKGDALSCLSRLTKESKRFSIIYIDPPYGKTIIEDCLKAIEEGDLLEKEGVLFVEEKSGKDQYSLTKLTLKTKRRFGGSELSEFVYKRVSTK